MAFSQRRSLHNRRFVDPFEILFIDPFEELASSAAQKEPSQENPKNNTVVPFAPLLAADLHESEKGYHLHVDIPGVSKENLDISFEDGVLTLKAERKEVFESNTVYHMAHRIERSYGKIQRSIRLPTNVDADNIQATLNDGVLQIIIPKLAPKHEKTLKIPIN